MIFHSEACARNDDGISMMKQAVQNGGSDGAVIVSAVRYLCDQAIAGPRVDERAKAIGVNGIPIPLPQVAK